MSHDDLLSDLAGPDPISRRRALGRLAYLLGGPFATSVLCGVVAGCRHSGDGAVAAALTAEQRDLLATLADHILPETDTPGARAVGVHDFIEAVWRACFSAEEQDHFVAGLAGLDEQAQRAHGQPFLGCTAAQQHALLADLDDETFRVRPPREPAEVQQERTEPGAGETPLPPEGEAPAIAWRWGEPPRAGKAAFPFWRTLKRLTLVGYYTSEAGATRELRHEPTPGRYDGCVPLAQVGRTWAV